MAKMTITKKASDWVKLKNNSSSLISFTYDSSSYEIEPGSFKNVKRHTAEIAVNAQAKTVEGKRVSPLEIEELPEDLKQTPSAEYPQAVQELEALKAKIELLETENSQLKQENEDLLKAEAQRNGTEPRKAGRPKGS